MERVMKYSREIRCHGRRAGSRVPKPAMRSARHGHPQLLEDWADVAGAQLSPS